MLTAPSLRVGRLGFERLAVVGVLTTTRPKQSIPEQKIFNLIHYDVVLNKIFYFMEDLGVFLLLRLLKITQYHNIEYNYSSTFDQITS